MPPSRKLVPSYLLHRQSGRGRAAWTDHTGTRQQKLLPGEYDSPESRTAFARLQLELATSPVATVIDRNGITLAEVLVAYLDFAEGYYRTPDGKPVSEPVSIKRSIKPVRELYGQIPAIEFGPLALKAVRQHMVGLDWCRFLVNSRIDRVKRAFKWAASEELVPPNVYEALSWDSVPTPARGAKVGTRRVVRRRQRLVGLTSRSDQPGHRWEAVPQEDSERAAGTGRYPFVTLFRSPTTRFWRLPT